MIQGKVIVKVENGLHLRPISEIVQITNKYKCKVYFIVSNKKIDAKSSLEIMSAGIQTNTEIIIQCEGEDEKKAMKELYSYFK